MTRSLYGGRPGDSVVSLLSIGSRRVLSLPVDANGDPTSVTLTVWDEPDGTQFTDLRAADGTTPIAQVVVPAETGQIPEFYGPDGVNAAVYIKTPAGDFQRIDARGDAAAAAAVAAQAAAEAARDQAVVAKNAAEAVGSTNDTIIAGRINTPGSATATALTASYVGFGTTDPSTFLPPGTEYVWNKTDGAGTLLDIVSGVA